MPQCPGYGLEGDLMGHDTYRLNRLTENYTQNWPHVGRIGVPL